MPDPKIEKFILEIIERPDGVSRWNRYKTDKKNLDLSKIELKNKDLKEFNFTDTNMAAADLFNSDLSGADLGRANLSYANLRRANLANAFLTGADMKVADLRGINAVDTNLDMTDLSHAKLNGAWMVGCSLADANLEGADLRGANLKFVNMSNAVLKGANVEEADLTNVNLSDEQIKSLRRYERAIIMGKAAGSSKTAPKKKKMKTEESYEELFAEEDCYKILGISSDASFDDIEGAYKTKAKEYHPDRVHHLGEKLQIVARREFERIQFAYKSLTQHKAKPAFSMDAVKDESLKKKTPSEMTIEDYLKLIKENPYNDKFYYNLGLLYFKKGFVDLAVNAYKKSLELNPDNTYARHNLKVAMLLKVLSGNKDE